MFDFFQCINCFKKNKYSNLTVSEPPTNIHYCYTCRKYFANKKEKNKHMRKNHKFDI